MNMNVEVHKFGGTCLASPEKLKKAINVLIDHNSVNNRQKIVVVSATFGATDQIRFAIESLNNGKDLCEECIKKISLIHDPFVQEMPCLETHLHYYLNNLNTVFQLSKTNVSHKELYLEQALITGELIMSTVFSLYLSSAGHKNTILTPEKLKLYTDGNPFNATVDLTKDYAELRQIIANTDGIIVIPGFYGINTHGYITTFGRSGSDYSATIIGNIVNASQIIIWKDVDGVMSADPKIVKNSTTIDFLNYDEASELAYYGASILHPLAMVPAKAKNIPIEVKNINTMKTTIIKSIDKKNTSINFVSYIQNIGIFQISKTFSNKDDDILNQFKKICENNHIQVLFISFSATQILFITGSILSEQINQLIKMLIPAFTNNIEYYSNLVVITVSYKKDTNPIENLTKLLQLFHANNITIRAISQGTVVTTYEIVVDQEHLESSLTLIHNELYPSYRAIRSDN